LEEEMPNPICHVDIPISDLNNGTDFYREVFGWEIHKDMPGYPMFAAEGGPGGGFIQAAEGESALIYLMSNDINASLADVEAHGGTVVMPRTEIEGGHGAIAIFKDPSGTKLALYSAPAQM
jgi:predicted enzyme related to lactoylglutathione lyase